jgi:hypothetical protein
MPNPQLDHGSLSLIEVEDDTADIILPNPSLSLRHEELGDQAMKSVTSSQAAKPAPFMMAAAKQSIVEQINQINKVHNELNNDINKQFQTVDQQYLPTTT